MWNCPPLSHFFFGLVWARIDRVLSGMTGPPAPSNHRFSFPLQCFFWTHVGPVVRRRQYRKGFLATNQPSRAPYQSRAAQRVSGHRWTRTWPFSHSRRTLFPLIWHQLRRHRSLPRQRCSRTPRPPRRCSSHKAQRDDSTRQHTCGRTFPALSSIDRRSPIDTQFSMLDSRARES